MGVDCAEIWRIHVLFLARHFGLFTVWVRTFVSHRRNIYAYWVHCIFKVSQKIRIEKLDRICKFCSHSRLFFKFGLCFEMEFKNGHKWHCFRFLYLVNFDAPPVCFVHFAALYFGGEIDSISCWSYSFLLLCRPNKWLYFHAEQICGQFLQYPLFWSDCWQSWRPMVAVHTRNFVCRNFVWIPWLDPDLEASFNCSSSH